MAGSLEHLVEEGVVSEVIARLKSGKEADVYVVRYGGNVVAAKVYKDRAHRSFKNNAAYKEGRSVRNSRSQRAMDRGTSFGRAAAEDAWKTAEATTLYKLHAAGVRVPTPVLFIDGVLLMELVLGHDGEPASRVVDMDLTAEQATLAYMDMLSQLVKILSCDLIHGDLSPYNVLWGAAGPTIIDFPQIVSASHNSSSEGFFLRDARNILDHFRRFAPALRARGGDAREIWRAYVRRELTPDFVPTGRARDPEPSRGSPPGRPPLEPSRDGGQRAPRPHGNANDHRAPRPRGNTNDHRGPRPQPNDQRAPRPAPTSHRGPRPGEHRGPRRPPAPEVIVLQRRPVPPSPATEAARPAPEAATAADSPNTRRRRRRRRH